MPARLAAGLLPVRYLDRVGSLIQVGICHAGFSQVQPLIAYQLLDAKGRDVWRAKAGAGVLQRANAKTRSTVMREARFNQPSFGQLFP